MAEITTKEEPNEVASLILVPPAVLTVLVATLLYAETQSYWAYAFGTLLFAGVSILTWQAWRERQKIFDIAMAGVHIATMALRFTLIFIT